MTHVYLTPSNDIVIAREILWSSENHLDDSIIGYDIKIGYTEDGTKNYILWYSDIRPGMHVTQNVLDKFEDLGDLE